MRLALLSDIHSNLQALEACLLHARSQKAQRFAFLGDLVGYGADPAAVIDRIMLGSGFPFERPASAVETILSLNSYALGTPLPAIPRASLRGIVERDAVSVLGLPSTLGPGSAARVAGRTASPLGPSGTPPRGVRPQ